MFVVVSVTVQALCRRSVYARPLQRTLVQDIWLEAAFVLSQVTPAVTHSESPYFSASMRFWKYQ